MALQSLRAKTWELSHCDVLDSDFTTTSQSFVDTGLGFPVVANGTYAFRFLIWGNGVGAPVYGLSLNGPTLVNLSAAGLIFLDNNGLDKSFINAYDGLAVNSSIAGNLYPATVEGIVKVSAAGTLMLRGRQVFGTSMTVKAGSCVEWYRVL